MLQWIRNSAIDRQKWDNCITTCPWGNIYSLSIYLDTLTNNGWEALVMGDYEFIMPVPLRSKFGIMYTYRPDFCQQLGIFSIHNQLTDELSHVFYAELSKRCLHIIYPLNFQNKMHHGEGLNFKKRTNFILELSSSYENLSAGFAGDLKRNLMKSTKAGLSIKSNIEVKKVVELYKNAWNHLYKISDQGYTYFEHLIINLAKNNLASTYGVYQENRLVAACVILRFKNRIYYPFSAISSEGRKTGAAAAMLAGILKNHENSGLIFDFEGSDLENVKFFYQKFNPIDQPYYQLEKHFKPWALMQILLKRRR